MKKTAIVIAGPTASGKTALSIRLARYFNTCILSADSRQCYRELNIGVAKPDPSSLQEIPHYFINSHSIQDAVDAAVYEQYGLRCLEAIFGKNNVAVVVGGTGLYLKALCEGVDQMPAIPEAIRNETRQQYYDLGMEWLQREVEKVDPEYYRNGEYKNPHRLMRALEFYRATGESIRSFQKGIRRERPFEIIKLGTMVPKEILYERINQRVDEMIAAGLEQEVRCLKQFEHLKALQTVGYREVFDHLNGLSSMEAAVEFIKRNTRQYAKRQLTWFKKDTAVHWFNPEEWSAILQFLTHRISN